MPHSEQGFLDYFNSSSFHRLLDCRIVALERDGEGGGTLTLRVPFSTACEREPGSQRFHGGIVAAVIDMAGAFAMIHALGRDVPSVALSVNYLRPTAVGADLMVQAVVRRAGRQVGLVDVEVSEAGDGPLIAVGRVTVSTVEGTAPTGGQTG